MKFCNIKLEHMYGPGDDESKFTSYIINSCSKNEPEIKLTPGEQKRDFIYIDDVVFAFQLLLNHKQDKAFEEYELGSGEPVTIREFVETAHRLTKSRSVLQFGALSYRENEVMHSSANVEALKALGWEPRNNLVDGLKKIIS